MSNIVVKAANETGKKLQMPEIKTQSATKLQVAESEADNSMFELLETSPKSILQGIIWSEIIGKPKSLRKGR